MTDFEYIKSCVSRIDLLAQLAEESAELAQAALKLHRKLIGANPTPKTLEECENNLIEECADVELCLELIGMMDEQKQAEKKNIELQKMKRWADRLREANDPFFITLPPSAV